MKEAIDTFKTANKTIAIFSSDAPFSPLDLYDDIGTLACFHGKYNLGHNRGSSLDDFTEMMANLWQRFATPFERLGIIRRVLKTLTPQEREDLFEAYADWHAGSNIGIFEHVVYEYRDFLFSDALRDWSEGIGLPRALISLPLFLYDHSGITMKTSRFGCRWDSGPVGFVWAERGKEGLTDDAITRCLISEVQTYSRYLEGDVYDIRIDHGDGNDDAEWMGPIFGYESALEEARSILVANGGGLEGTPA